MANDENYDENYDEDYDDIDDDDDENYIDVVDDEYDVVLLVVVLDDEKTENGTVILMEVDPKYENETVKLTVDNVDWDENAEPGGMTVYDEVVVDEMD